MHWLDKVDAKIHSFVIGNIFIVIGSIIAIMNCKKSCKIIKVFLIEH